MPQDFSAPALLHCVRSYYPEDISIEDPRYALSEQRHRLKHLMSSAATATGAWQRFLKQVEAAFPTCDVSDTVSLPHHPSYHCEVTLEAPQPRFKRTRVDSVACMLSLLAPVYALYARHWKDDRIERESWARYPPFPPEFQEHEIRLARLIEGTFGFTRLPNEVLFTPVPGVHPSLGRSQYRQPRLVELLF